MALRGMPSARPAPRPQKQKVELPPAVPGSRRRMRVAMLTCVTLLAVTASLVIANVVTDRYKARIDVTAAGNQRIAPRTQRLLDQLDQPYRVVIAADLKLVDQRSRERAKDVLSELSRASRNFKYQIIDTGSPAGVSQYRSLVTELVARDQKIIDEQRAAIELASGAAAALSTYLTDKLAPAQMEIQNGISPGTDLGRTNREYFEQAAAAAKVLAKDLSAASARANEELRAKLDDIAVPATDRAGAALIGIMGPAVDQLTEGAKQLRQFAAWKDVPGPAADMARPLVTAVEEQRDRAAVVLDSLRKLKRLDLLRVMDALKSGNAALIIGPPEVGLAAVDVDALLPSAAWLDATGTGGADLQRRVEELLATAIGSLTTPVHPIVVFMHAEQRAFFDNTEVLKATFGQLVQRMQFRGIDVIEWAVVVQPEPPRLRALNVDGKRPVVYVSLPPDSSAGSSVQGAPNGVQRAAKLGEVLASLALSGKNLLVSVSPCVLPTYGQPDPVGPALARFGLAADSGRPLLRERLTPRRLIDTEQVATAEESTTPMGGAVRGLPMLTPWPVPLYERTQDTKARLQMTRLYTVAAAESTWAESQWLRLWQTPEAQRAMLPEQDLPQFDKDRDGKWPQGPGQSKAATWLVAAAVERSEVGASPQRLVVVGANYWFFDKVAQPRVFVEGRVGAAHPGNNELFESSVSWLAGQDDLIAQSPSAQAFAIVQPMDTKVLSGLRMTTILGLPLGVLVLGLLYRLVRG